MIVDVYALLRHASAGLVDQLAVESLPAELEAIALRPYWFDGSSERLPGFVDLRDRKAGQAARLLEHFDASIKNGDAPSISMLLFSATDEHALRRHLTDRLTVRHNGRQALLRYFDPRVLLQLSWMLSPAQLSWLLGPIDRFAYCLADGWHLLERPQSEAVSGQGVDTQRIARLGAINEVAFGLDAVTDRDDVIAISRGVETALRRAEQLGFQDEDDRIAFAHHAITVHPRFDTHPQIVRLLASVNTQASYRDCAALLNAEDWQRIRDELDGNAQTRNVS